MSLPAPVLEAKIKPNPIVEITQGKLEGFILQSRKGRDYYGFYGIPYAKKPERFQPPEKWESWEGILDATKARDRCVQASMITKRVFGSEDCLFLNIFTPFLPSLNQRKFSNKSPSKLPVMVFIYGGGFYVGGGDLYGGKYLVEEDVILVTFNYRLGALGFLNSGDGQVRGNMGLKDQVMCLKWVQENIQYFGGDKDQVTIFGESAGAACVHYHTLSHMSKGLFKKAIMQSGTALSPWAFSKDPATLVKRLVQQLGINCDINNMSEMIQALKDVDARAIAAQTMDFSGLNDFRVIYFSPSVDSGIGTHQDTFITESPINILHSGKIPNEVPMIIGANAQEGVYKSVPALKDPEKIKALNENWVEEMQGYFLKISDTDTNANQEFANAVKKFYFGNQPISQDTRERFTDLISDRYFLHSTKMTGILHSSFHKKENPIFMYLFCYDGEFSFLNSYGIFETFGPCHADELQYLMNQRIFYSKIARGTEDDMMIEKMTAMWTNFCKLGIPRHSGPDYMWEPVPHDKSIKPRPLKYYQISEVDQMIDEPFKSRLAFWESLPYDLH